MNQRLVLLAYRRIELLQKIEAQRMYMAEIFQHLKKPLAVADVGVKAAHFVYSHRALFASVMTALVTWRQKGIVGLAKNSWRLLYLYPSSIFFGLKYLTSHTNESKAELTQQE